MGASDVGFVRGDYEITFLEVTLAGNVNSTSVLLVGWKRAPTLDKQSLPAVHSRHVASLEELLVSQYIGFCEPKF